MHRRLPRLAALAAGLLLLCALSATTAAADTTATDLTATTATDLTPTTDTTATAATEPATVTVTTAVTQVTVTHTQPTASVTGSVSVSAEVTTTSGGGSSSSSSWIWYAAGVALLLAVAGGLMAWQRSRSKGSREWLQRAAALGHEGLLVLDLARADADPTGAAPNRATLARRLDGLQEQAQSLQRDAPDDAARQELAHVGMSIDALSTALATDQALRTGPPAPGAEQLGYSSAQISQRVNDLEPRLRTLAAAGEQ
jgi:hypothetical protein